jgi:transcriptional regulator with GAF, ATPase, and Fis domain
MYSGAKFKEVLAQVEQVASTDATVLVLGETGTGKELIAKAIHNLSQRKGRPLIKLNCAALPKELIESELFGHEKGAFTGAIAKKIGRFELADGGTIFLDEIGEMPLELQPKLLRVLQEGEFERVGGTETKKVDVRVVAATNRDLESERQTGQFRADLYYRLNVFPIKLPPLRERRDDISGLVWFFVKKFNQKFQREVAKIPERLMARLEGYDWPGNVRELENLMERAMILSKGNVLNEEAFNFAKQNNSDEPFQACPLSLDQVEKNHILKVLEMKGWKINGENGAASALGLKPSTLRDRMKKLAIERP